MTPGLPRAGGEPRGRRDAERIAPVPRGGDLPLSFAQQRMWFRAQLDPGGASLNAPFVLELEGTLDAAALHRALCEIVRRHEALRTRFAEHGGRPVQRIAAEADVPLPVDDLAALPDGERRAAADQLARREFLAGFDLEAGPVVRARLLRLAAGRHRLLLTVHHIAWDGWSVVVFARELAALYRAFATGEAPALPELAVQVADFASWQRVALDDAALEPHLAFWRDRLAGAPPALDLPADRPRPPVASLRGARIRRALPAELADAVRALARRRAVTPFFALLAGFNALVCRYTGSDDFVVGTVMAGRNRRELEPLIGVFVNAVPLRIDCSGDPSFGELLVRARRVCIEAFAHQDLPFERLAELAAQARDASRAPLFQVLVGQRPDWPRLELPGLSVRIDDAAFDAAMFDLSLFVQDTPAAIVATWEYSTALFDAATIERTHAHWIELLAAAVAEPDRPIAELAIVPPSELRTLLVDWNPPASLEPDPVCLPELFEQQVARTPSAPAVVSGAIELSYRELDHRAARLARRLRAIGAGSDARVAVCTAEPLDAIIAILGILKAGAAYAALDPAHPAERLRYLIGDLRPIAVLGPRIAGLDGATVLPVDDPAADERAGAVAGPAPRAPCDALAYIIYTSGSTGAPKGVMISHGAIARRLAHARRFFALGAGDTGLQAAALGFDASVLEIFVPLTSGARLALIAPADRADPERLARSYAEARVGFTFVVPSVLAALLDAGMDVAPRRLVCGGEALPGHVRDRCLARFGSIELTNCYGPTECTIYVTLHTFPPDDAGRPVVLGRPLGASRGYVLDRRLRPVPAGVTGELWVGGDCLARGYLDRPALTAERFVPDPFSAAPGARMYRTGDLVRWRAGGELEYLGRVDHQVKLRGFRIELGEIEAVLGAHPGVAGCAAAVVAAGGAPQLVAYVVPGGRPAPDREQREGRAVGAEPAERALREHLQARLPDYMVPSAFIVLDSLPRTASGKIDRAALPPPASRRAAGAAPRTAIAELVAEIWQQLLRCEAIGAHDSFFALGGHSLLATQVTSRLRRVLGISLPVTALFEAPTLDGFARAVQSGIAGAAAPAAPPAATRRPARLPLSFAQHRLWFLDRLEPGGFTYNVPWFARLTGPLRVDLLEASLADVVRRHEVLRTRFVEVDGQPEQVIAPGPAAALDVPVDDVPARTDPEPALRAWTEREARRPFSLADGPPIRARLLRLAPDHHVLVIAMHHIVCDDWSIAVLVRELAAGYAARLRGEPPALPAPALQYADYAIWQRDRVDGGAAGRLAYWTEQLAGAPELVALPTDRPRPPAQTTRGAMVRTRLAPDVIAAARRLGRDAGATLYMTLLAAYCALLHRYTGQDDLVIGSPIAGRDHEELEDLIGLFVNSLALRIRIDGDASFRALLAHVREVCLQAHAHGDVPFERVVEAVRPVRDPGHTPVFQVMFVLQSAPPPALALPGLAAEPLFVHPGMAKFDLTLFVQDTGDGLDAGWEYNADLFDRATVERIAGHYARLLDQLVCDPEQRPAAVAFLSAAERDEILARSTTVRAGPAADRSLHALFAEQVARTPDATALVFDRARLSYAELDARANRLARYLASRGIAGEQRVGLCLGRSIDFVVAALATIKAGGCYVPLDPSYPAERLAYMVADAGVRVVLARSQGGAGGPPVDLAATGAELVALAAIEPELARLDGSELPVTATASSLAYVMYTSGSTGQPKGTCIEQRSVAGLVLGADHVQLGPTDVVAHISSTSFDAATIEIWGALLSGATVHGIAPDTLMSPDALARELASAGITALFITPALFHQLAAARPEMFRSLGHLVIGGDVVEPGAVRRVLAAGPPRRLVNAYGPTETTTFTTWQLVHGPGEAAASIPIGRPIAGATVRILDRHRALVPAGVRGEIYLGGDGLARGYWNRPALTAERFVPDPFAPGARLYRTGDLAVWRGDGAIEFHGRRDHQVKLRGFRIELGEIEARLLAHPDVAEAVAVVRDDAGDRRLVAYAVPRAGAALEPDELRARLAAALPHYMMPGAIVALARLPVTPNGKLDRRALPAPAAVDPARDPGWQTSTEQRVAAIWAEVLAIEPPSRGAEFFALGGHSLIAMRVVAHVRDAFGVELPVREVFEAPVLADLAARIDARLATARAVLPALTAAPRDRAPPASFAQRRLWFLDQLHPGSAHYHIPVARRLRGRLDRAALERSLDAIVRRHEALRTSFVELGGQLVQRIAEPGAFVVAVDDLAALPAADREAALASRLRAHAERPFDLAAGPLIRAALFRLGDDDHVLALVVHHIVCDGWSLAVMDRELAALYPALAAGAVPALPPLPVQPADHAAWQWQHRAMFDADVAWWTAELAGAPPALDLPTDRPRPAIQRHLGAALRSALPGELTARLRELARREGATMFMVLLAAFDALVFRYTGQGDVVVGSPVAGRSHRDTEGLIGMFANTLALRARVVPGEPFRALVARVRRGCLAAVAHQAAPFEQLVEAINPRRDVSRSPIFQVAFALHTANRPPALPGLSVEDVAVDLAIAKYDLSLELQDTGDAVVARWEYSTELFDAGSVAAIARAYVQLVEAAVADPDRPVAALPLVTAAERERPSELAAASAPAPAEPVHEQIAAAAARWPDRPAVLCGEQRVSHGELAARAGRLAGMLRELGVERGHIVGLCLDRSIDMVVALLAILRAGAAYLPLDPALPEARLAFMTGDARPSVIVTQARHRARLPGHGPRIVCVDQDRAAIERHAPGWARDARSATLDDLAYVLYTSGSTGVPKGVAVSHRALANLLASTREQPGLTAGDVVLAVTTLSFDVAAVELYLPLVVGARIVIATRDATSDGRQLLRLIREHGATFMQATPSTWRLMLDAGWDRDGVPPFTVVTAGEALTGELAAALIARARCVWNMYGPTETTVYSTGGRIEDPLDAVSIGRPIAHTTCHVLDGDLRPVPRGARGELYIGGLGVARGYLGRPELTAQRFVPDPFSPVPGARLYRTGDLVRIRGDGGIAFLGRADHQVKLRGFRIEPGEIEAAIARHAGVRDCAVVLREDVAGDRRLVAYVVPGGAAAGDLADQLRAALRAALPDYMVPSAFVALSELPLTPSRKLDRAALPAPSVRRDELGGSYVAPDGELERAIARIWAGVLGVDRVGATDNFFDLGGSSLLLQSVRSQIEAVIGRALPMVALFQFAQVRSLAAYLAHPREPDAPAPAAPDPSRRKEGARRLGERRRGRTAKP